MTAIPYIIFFFKIKSRFKDDLFISCDICSGYVAQVSDPWPVGLLSRQIYLYDRGDFQSLSHDLTEIDWSLVKDNDVDTNAQNVINRIYHLVNKQIPNKLVHVRKSYPSWLTNNTK